MYPAYESSALWVNVGRTSCQRTFTFHDMAKKNFRWQEEAECFTHWEYPMMTVVGWVRRKCFRATCAKASLIRMAGLALGQPCPWCWWWWWWWWWWWKIQGKYANKIESSQKNSSEWLKVYFKVWKVNVSFGGAFLSNFVFCFEQLGQSAATLIGWSWVIPVGFPRNKYQISTHFSSRIFEE